LFEYKLLVEEKDGKQTVKILWCEVGESWYNKKSIMSVLQVSCGIERQTSSPYSR